MRIYNKVQISGFKLGSIFQSKFNENIFINIIMMYEDGAVIIEECNKKGVKTGWKSITDILTLLENFSLYMF